MSRSLLFSLIFGFISVASGYSPITPFQYVSALRGSQHFFVMVPGSYAPTYDQEYAGHSGVAYTIGEDGSFKVKWKVKGWYAYPGDVFLSREGVSLARVVTFPHDAIPAKNDALERQIVLIFYRNGKVIKKYRCEELGKNLAAGIFPPYRDSFVHTGRDSPAILDGYQLQSTLGETREAHLFDSYKSNDEFLVLETVEAKLVFDLKTGKLLQKLKVE